jgi:hypothetical protein
VSETPMQAADRRAGKLMAGTEAKIAQANQTVRETTAPLSIQQRVAGAARNMRDAIVDTTTRLVNRIRDLFR